MARFSPGLLESRWYMRFNHPCSLSTSESIKSLSGLRDLQCSYNLHINFSNPATATHLFRNLKSPIHDSTACAQARFLRRSDLSPTRRFHVCKLRVQDAFNLDLETALSWSCLRPEMSTTVLRSGVVSTELMDNASSRQDKSRGLLSMRYLTLTM